MYTVVNYNVQLLTVVVVIGFKSDERSGLVIILSIFREPWVDRILINIASNGCLSRLV